MGFVRRGFLDVCQGNPIPHEYDGWDLQSQTNYEAGRMDAANVLRKSPKLKAQLIAWWPEHVLIPKQINELLGRLRPEGSPLPATRTPLPNDPDVQAKAFYVASGRRKGMPLPVPTVKEQ